MFKKFLSLLLISTVAVTATAAQIDTKYIKDGAVTNAKIAASTIDLTTKVTGALPVANGGTGQTSASGSFDGLAPTTTKGDLVVRNATTNVRKAVGTNGTFLKSDSSDSTGVVWTSTISTSVTRSVTGTDTATNADDLLIFSGASFTETLFTAVGNTGKILTFVHNGTNLTQVYTLDGNGSETICGSLTYGLYTNQETLRIISDGANWLCLSHFAQTDWIAFPSVAAGTLITGTGSNPAYGTVVNNNAYWRRNGRMVDIKWDYRQSAVSATPGTGNYLFNLPSGITIDTAYVIVNSSTGATAGSGNDSASIGDFRGSYTTNSFITGILVAYSSTQFKAHVSGVNTGVNTSAWGPSNWDFALNAALAFNIRANFAVTNWKP